MNKYSFPNMKNKYFMTKNDKFEHWFKHNLKVRVYPNLLDLENKYIIGDTQIIINVSDCMKPEIYSKVRELGIEYFWFPMNESSFDIGLNSIYGACTILSNAEKENKNVLIHCWSGNNRSQLVAQSYYYLRAKKHYFNEYKGYVNQLVYNCENGYLPEKNKMEYFLNYLSNSLNYNSCSGNLDKIKKAANV
jgi:hypothetical protein